MAFNTNITPGSPPLLWSDVHEAFVKVNENFDILVATIGTGSGLTPINFETLDTSVSPTTTNTYQLGSITNQWKSVFTGEFTTIDPLNGLWAGSAQIKGVGLTVNLPENSTIGGDPLTGIGTRLIIDPTRVFFKEVQIDNNDVIVAQEDSNKFGINSGNGISMTVDSSAESVEINNTGILSVVNGAGITGSTVSGVATVTNDGVVSFSNSTTLPVAAAGRTAGAGIVVSAVKGIGINITNTGVLDIQAGSAALTVSKDTATGVITITNPSPAQNAFTQIEVDGDSGDRLIADSINDVLNLVGSTEIVLTKNSSTDTVTFSLNPVFDLKGSVFGDDSTKIIDAVENEVYATGGIFSPNGYFTGIETDTITTNSIFLDIVNANPAISTTVRRYMVLPGNHTETYSTCNGTTGTGENNFIARGTLNVPQALQPGDILYGANVLGHDGSDYQLMSALIHLADLNQTISTGVVPGSIGLATFTDGNPANFKGMFVDSRGYVSVNNGLAQSQATLDINGFAKLAVLTAPPSVLVNGLIAIADGTIWNPTSSGVQTVVAYINSSWVALS